MKIRAQNVFKVLVSILLIITLVNIQTTTAAAVGDTSKDLKVISMAAGQNTSYVVLSDGTLWSWGKNDKGQLGDQTLFDQPKPIKIMDFVSKIIAGPDFAFAIKEDGSLWAWGSNTYGQIGNGNAKNQLSPYHVMDAVLEVSVGVDHVLVIKEDQSLWGWGDNYNLQIDGSGAYYYLNPVKIMDGIVKASAGDDFSAAVTLDGQLLTWGENDNGQLGFGTEVEIPPYSEIMPFVKSVNAGSDHAVALRDDNSLWVWGDNYYGQVGDNTRDDRYMPRRILKDVVSFSTKANQNFAIKKDSTLWAWGNSSFGQVGNGLYLYQPVPVKILENVAMVESGYTHAMAVKKDGSLWLWGSNTNGELGNGKFDSSSTPLLFEYELPSEQIVGFGNPINVSGSTSFVINSDGSLWGWGDNGNYELAVSSPSKISTPVFIMNNVTAFSADTNALAVRNDGSLWSWGSNYYGEIGDGTTSRRSAPIKILDNIVSAESGFTSFAVGKDGSLWGWGYNYYGQVGNGTTTQQNTPVKIMEGVASVSAKNHTLAVKSDGSLWAWGDNYEGQLGDGTTTNRKLPYKVMDGVQKARTCGLSWAGCSVVLKKDGTLWAWGANDYGILGKGGSSLLPVKTPTKVMDGVLDFSLGGGHILVIKQDHTLWAWGDNGYGQLGVGTETDVYTPTKIMQDVQYVFTSTFLSGAVTNSGKVFMWGTNSSYEISPRETKFYTSPIEISKSIINGYSIDTSEFDQFGIPIFENAPAIRLSYPLDINARYTITSQSKAGNFTIDSTNRITATSEGQANVKVTDASGSKVYKTLTISAYAKKATISAFPLPKTMTFSQGFDVKFENVSSALLDGNSFAGGLVSEEGNHVITYFDKGGIPYRTTFTVDSTAPVISVDPYGTSPTSGSVKVTAQVNEGSLLFRGVEFLENGSAVFQAIDAAGNRSLKTVTIDNIDRIKPVVTGVNHKRIYLSGRTITFNEGKATLNGTTISSGTSVTDSGKYHLVVTDSVGNTTTVDFKIDLSGQYGALDEDPVISQALTLSFTSGTALLNGSAITSGKIISDEGKYLLEITDTEAYQYKNTITIDKTKPILYGIVNQTTYRTPKSVVFSEGSALLNGKAYQSGDIIATNGNYELILKDPAGNTTKVQFTIQITGPIVSGVQDGQASNKPLTITFDQGLATLNGRQFTSGQKVSADGDYTLVVQDVLGSTTTVQFVIDTIAPVITGIANDQITSDSVTLSFSEGDATLDGNVVVSGSVVSTEGKHSLIVTDKAGNTTKVSFEIDKTAPIVSGVTDGQVTTTPTKITFNEGTALFNGAAFISGTTINKPGTYELIVSDNAGNQTTIAFKAISATPVVSGVEDRGAYPHDVTLSFEDSTATLNGQTISSGFTITEEGSYELIVTDVLNHSTTLHFTLDKTAPILQGVIDDQWTTGSITIAFNEGTAELNGEVVLNETLIDQEGSYDLVVTDDAGNETSVHFVIDRTKPVISGLESKEYLNGTPIITFDEGEAVLDGKPFMGGQRVTTSGNHVISVTDKAGNTSEISFSIQKQAVTLSGLKLIPVKVGSFELSWTDNPFVESVDIYRSSSLNGSYTKIATTTSGKYLDSGLVTGTTYAYKVLATLTDGSTALVGQFSTPIQSVLTVPTVSALSVTLTNYDSQTLKWEGVIGATGYEIEAAIGTGAYKVLGTSTTTSYAHLKLTPGTSYSYRLRAYVTVGKVKVYGAYSTVVKSTPIPLASSKVSVTSDSPTSLMVTWSAVSGATGYDLMVSTTPEGTYTKFGSTVTGTSAKLTGLVTNQTYYVKVKAYRSTNKVYGLLSEAASAAPLPVSPLVSAVSIDATSIKLSWKAVTGATGYLVLWKNPTTNEEETIYEGNLLSFVHQGLSPGVAQSYRVVPTMVVNKVKILGNASAAIVSRSEPLIPSGLVAVSGGINSIALSWTLNSDAQEYWIYRSESLTGEFKKIGQTKTNSYLDSNLTFNKKYYYTVKAAVSGASETILSQATTAVMSAPLPLAPANIAITLTNYDSQSLKWDSVSGVSGYEIEAAIGTGAYKVLGTSTTPTYAHLKLTPGTAYSYRLRSYVTVGKVKVYGSYSGVVKNTPVPLAPASVSVTSDGPNSLAVSWTAVSGATGYDLLVSTTPEGTYTKFGSTVTGTSAKITGLITNQTYYVKVKAYRSTNKVYGLLSEPASSRPLPLSTVLTAASNDASSIKLSWKAVTGASGYMVLWENPSSGEEEMIYEGNLLSFVHQGLTQGVTQSYRVVPTMTVNSAKILGPASLTSQATPISNETFVITATPEFNQITITWTHDAMTTLYQIVRVGKEANQVVGTLTADTFDEALSFTDKNLDNNTLYSYQVIACQIEVTEGCAPAKASNIASATTKLTKPLGINSWFINSKETAIDWNNVLGADGYEVYRSTSLNGTYAKIADTTLSSLRNSGLAANTTYFYKIKAYTTVSGKKLTSDLSEAIVQRTAQKASLGVSVTVGGGVHFTIANKGSLPILLTGGGSYDDSWNIMDTLLMIRYNTESYKTVAGKSTKVVDYDFWKSGSYYIIGKDSFSFWFTYDNVSYDCHIYFSGSYTITESETIDTILIE